MLSLPLDYFLVKAFGPINPEEVGEAGAEPHLFAARELWRASAAESRTLPV
jgi:hypothetical protein